MGSMIWNRMALRVPPILRPRWTWRYLLCFSVATYAIYNLLFARSLLSSNLPAYTGPYQVGTIDLEAPCEPRRINDATLKEGQHPAFQVETVLFTLYYPSVEGAKSSKPHHLWIPRPLGIVGAGYARFARISNFLTNSLMTFGLWALAGGIKIPAHVDVPLHHGPAILQTPAGTSLVEVDDGFPVLVFSHGMASSRTQYTQYCGELASRGHVVAAIEHRDGSGPGTVIMNSLGRRRTLLHFSHRDLHHDAGLDADTFKQAQLDFRQAEVEETMRVLKHINAGHGDKVFSQNTRGEGQHLKHWRDRLAVDNATIGGHSFGATLALQTLKDGPTKHLPFQSAVVLDPGKQSGPLNHDVNVSTLVIHSNSWSSRYSIFYGRAHFDVVKDVVLGVLERGKAAWFMTSLGTSHPSVTDAPLIEPLLLNWATGSSIDAHEGVRQYVKVSEMFLQYQMSGVKKGILSECVTHPEYNLPDERRFEKGKSSNDMWKYWQIHAAPCGPEAVEDESEGNLYPETNPLLDG